MEYRSFVQVSIQRNGQFYAKTIGDASLQYAGSREQSILPSTDSRIA
jgi:hypothetical protein